MKLAGLIPALDCAETIGEVVRGARESLEHVLVVDDGSHDGTAVAWDPLESTCRHASLSIL